MTFINKKAHRIQQSIDQLERDKNICKSRKRQYLDYVAELDTRVETIDSRIEETKLNLANVIKRFKHD
jgi:hypothetical protein